VPVHSEGGSSKRMMVIAFIMTLLVGVAVGVVVGMGGSSLAPKAKTGPKPETFS